MINIVDRYFKFNRILLLMVGLWPYEKSKLIQLQFICIFSILITCTIFQLTTILTSKCTIEFIIKILSTIITFSAFIIKYNFFYVNSNTVKYLMEQVQHIYNDLRDNDEIAIVEKYGGHAKQYTVGLTTFISAIFINVGVQLWSNFAHIILSANVSQSHHLQISTEYFIDQERYFYISLFHTNVALILGSVVFLATMAILVAYVQHVCGMFQIASYRIERAIQIYILQNINIRNEIPAHKGIIRAIDIHRKAITFANHLISRFEILFMFLIVAGVLSSSLNVFRVFQIALLGYNTEFLLNLLIAIAGFVYMFMANFMGQQIIDHNNHVFATAYKVKWYATPLHVQRLILFLLQRGTKSFGLCVGGLFIASMECFATLANASISYFIIMYSMR